MVEGIIAESSLKDVNKPSFRNAKGMKIRTDEGIQRSGRQQPPTRGTTHNLFHSILEAKYQIRTCLKLVNIGGSDETE